MVVTYLWEIVSPTYGITPHRLARASHRPRAAARAPLVAACASCLLLSLEDRQLALPGHAWPPASPRRTHRWRPRGRQRSRTRAACRDPRGRIDALDVALVFVELAVDLVLELRLELAVAPLPRLERGGVDPPEATHTPRTHELVRGRAWARAGAGAAAPRVDDFVGLVDTRTSAPNTSCADPAPSSIGERGRFEPTTVAGLAASPLLAAAFFLS